MHISISLILRRAVLLSYFLQAHLLLCRCNAQFLVSIIRPKRVRKIYEPTPKKSMNIQRISAWVLLNASTEFFIKVWLLRVHTTAGVNKFTRGGLRTEMIQGSIETKCQRVIRDHACTN